MKRIFTLLLCLASAATYAQKKKPTAAVKQDKDTLVTVYGKFENALNDTVVVLTEAYSQEAVYTYIKKNKFELTMGVPKGGSVYILQVGNSGEKGGTVLYLESGICKVEGKGPYFEGASFTGSPWVKEWQEVMDITSPFEGDGKTMADLQETLNKAIKIGDEDVADSCVAHIQVLDKKMRDTLIRWVSNHPNSGPSGYTATTFFPQKAQRDSVVALLGEHALKTRYVQRYLYPGKIDKSNIQFKLGEGAADPSLVNRLKAGDKAPGFTLPDVNGKNVSLSDYKGKYLFIDFWASWCGPCLPQIPFLQDAYAKYKNQNFAMLAVSMDSKRAAWVDAIAKHKLSWTNVSSLKGWADTTAAAYGVTYIPSNVLINPEGVVIARDLYNDQIDAKLAEIFKMKPNDLPPSNLKNPTIKK
ncbi:peroxiredoxin [Chitinophaga skermanii]|uniref:Peroxiredoxin n=1 Tax=Chitinophaga skermanii TaxID=331697 RepID=A0A327QV51_9BACT|nr:TlpA disulfide reductase family protein [Chitinophaga skermanii]RAJ08250.1 peroxiredoxin [Chitinophaga skermanii]